MQKQEYLKVRKELAKKGLFKKTNLKPLFLVFVEMIALSIIIIGLIVVDAFSPTYWLLEAFLGLSIFRFFVLTHECGHATLFASRKLNRAFGFLFGCLCAVPFTCWRKAHFEHHKWVGIVDKDPTSEGLLSIKQYNKLQRLVLTVIWKSRVPIAAFGGIVMAFWLYPFKQLKKGNTANAKAGLLSIIYTGSIIGLICFLLGESSLTYLLPALIFFYIFFESINLTHHSGLYPYTSHSHPQPIPLYEQGSHCRTALMPKWLSAITCYHFNLHSEHHLFPTIPWHNLPKVHAYFQSVNTTSFNNVDPLAFMTEIRSLDPFEAFVDSVPNNFNYE